MLGPSAVSLVPQRPALHRNRTVSAGLVAGFLAIVAGGCKSPAQHRADADREAYELVLSRRERLSLGEAEFTIEPDPERLDQRVRRGEVNELGTLRLVDFLQIAAENSREYQTQKENLYLSALDLTLERWRFALQKGGALGAALDGSGWEAESASGSGLFSLSKLLGTGARIVGDIGLSVGRSLLSSDGWHATSDIGLAVTQPLLAGAGETVVKEPLTQAERDLVYSVRAFERFRRTFAFDVTTRFYRLLQTADQVRNQVENVRNLEQLTARNRALAEAGRLSDLDLGQALQNQLRSQNDLLDIQAQFEVQLDEFKIFLGLPVTVTVQLDPADLQELIATQPPETELDEAVISHVALTSRLDYITTVEREEDAVRQVVVAEDALQGLLNVNAELGWTSVDGQPFKYDESSWRLGLEYAFPFERLPQRNAWRQAIIRRAAAARTTDLAEDRIRANLRDDLRQTTTQLEGWRIQKISVDLADRRIESTRLQLDAGLADTRDLLEAQESLLSAQNAATRALIDYTLARMGLYLDMELLRVDHKGIELLQPPGEVGP